MTTTIRIVLAAFVSFATLCVAQSRNAPLSATATPYQDVTAYEVYRAILARPCEEASAGRDWENWGCDVQGAKPLLIRTDTVSPYKVTFLTDTGELTISQCDKLESVADADVTKAIANWKSINDETWLLADKFDLPMGHKVISAGELKESFERTPECKTSLSTPFGARCAWETFTERFPNAGGWIELSAVGFNPERNVAVVYISHRCGRLCGRGFAQVLRKRDGAWIPMKWAIKGCGWMS